MLQKGKRPTDKPTSVKCQKVPVQREIWAREQLYKVKCKSLTVSDPEKRFTVNDGSYILQYTVGISINLSLEWTVPQLQMLTPSPNISSAIVYNSFCESSKYTFSY